MGIEMCLEGKKSGELCLKGGQGKGAINLGEIMRKEGRDRIQDSGVGGRMGKGAHRASTVALFWGATKHRMRETLKLEGSYVLTS